MAEKLAWKGLSPAMAAFSKALHFVFFANIVVLLPSACRNMRSLGSSPVARRYWGNHVCFIFLEVLRCFSSLGLPA